MSLILAISGPAAVGKTTICERLMKDFGVSLNRLVTATTRLPRKGEQDGEDYFFLTQSEFDRKLLEDHFLEHEIIHGNKYGILKHSLLEAQIQGVDILLNIDVNGSASLRRFCNETKALDGCLKTVFIRPQCIAELKSRMNERASESDEQMQIRLANAQAEMQREHEFDFILESADRESDYQRVKEIYLSLK